MSFDFRPRQQEPSDDEIELGLALLNFHVHSSDWVAWRHETIELPSDVEVRTKSYLVVDCDNYCADADTGVPSMSDFLLYPIALIRPQHYLNREVLDAAGGLVDQVPQHTVRRLQRAGLLGMLPRELNNDEVPELLKRYVLEAPFLDFSSLAAQLNEGLAAEDAFHEDFRVAVNQIAESQYISITERKLKSDMLVVALAAEQDDHRHRHTFTYETRRPLEASSRSSKHRRQARRERAKKSFGVRPFGFQVVDIEVPTTGASGANFDVVAPTGLGFSRGHLLEQIRSRKLRSKPTRTFSTHIEGEFDPRIPVSARLVRAELAHPPRGIVHMATFSVLATLVMLSIGANIVANDHSHQLPGNDEASVTLLLIVLGLVGPSLLEKSPHPMVSNVQRPSRYILYVVFFATFVVAGATAIGAEPVVNLRVWLGAVSISLAALMLLSLQWVQLRRAWRAADADIEHERWQVEQ